MNSRWKNLAVVALTALIALGVVEVGLRVFGIFPSVSGPPRYLARADLTQVYSLVPDGVWRHSSQEFNYTIRTNQNGFRGPDWNFDRPGIAILGSSEVFGFGNAWADTFPARLQSMVTDGGLDHQIRNMGVFGHNLLQVRDAFNRWKLHQRFAATVIQVDWRAVITSSTPSIFEVVDGYLVEVGRFPDGKLSPAYRIYGYSYSHSRAAAVFIDGVRRLMGPSNSDQTPQTADAALSPDDIQAAVRAAAIVDEIRIANGEKPFGVFLMAMERRQFDAMNTALEARGIDVINTWNVSKQLGMSARYPIDGHMTADGNAIVAQSIGPWLRANLAQN